MARSLALCWGVTPLLLPESSSSAEGELAFGIEWAKPHALVRPGQHVVLLRGQVAGQPKSRAVLTGEVS